MQSEMSFNEYQAFCQSVRLPSSTPEYCLLNLCGETGELFSLVAKSIRDGRKFDHEQNVKKELGDILWSVATVALDNGFTLEDIALGNHSKLSKRKIDGTFQGSGDDR